MLRDQFEKEIEENPHDHFVKLAYADWLEEEGDPSCHGWRWLGLNEKVPVSIVARSGTRDEFVFYRLVVCSQRLL